MRGARQGDPSRRSSPARQRAMRRQRQLLSGCSQSLPARSRRSATPEESLPPCRTCLVLVPCCVGKLRAAQRKCAHHAGCNCRAAELAAVLRSVQASGSSAWPPRACRRQCRSCLHAEASSRPRAAQESSVGEWIKQFLVQVLVQFFCFCFLSCTLLPLCCWLT